MAVCQWRLIAQLFGLAVCLPVAVPLHSGSSETFHYLSVPLQDHLPTVFRARRFAQVNKLTLP